MTTPEDTEHRESERLAALKNYDVLDTEPEEAFDRVTRLVSTLTSAPIALVSLVDESRQWFKSRVGLEASETPRSDAFCAHAIHSDAIMEVPDASKDPRFADNPLVTGAPHIRFYAGAPLIAPEGHRLGTLCIIDTEPRSLGKEHASYLTDFSRIVVDQLELRKATNDARSELEERKRIEVARQASESRFDTLVEGSLQGIQIHDGERLVFANQRLADIFGYDNPQELLALESYELLVAPHDRARMRERYEKRMRGEHVSAVFECQGLRKDGTPVDLLRSAHTVEWNGQTAVQNTVIDISEQKNAIRELQWSQRILAALADNLPEFISLKDAEGRFQFVNKRFEEWVQVDRNDVIGKTVHDIYDPRDAAEFEALDHDVIAQGKISSTEFDFSYPDGQTRHVIATRYPVFSDCGDIIGSGTIDYDLSERRRLEEAVERSEAELRALLDGSVMGVAIDRAGKPIFANQRLADIFGYDSPEELLALESYELLIAPHDRARMRSENLDSVLECQGLRKDGSSVDLLQSARTVEWEGQAAVQNTVIDVSEQKQAIRELRWSQRILAALADNLPQFISLKDAEGRFQFVNKRFEEWVQIDRDDVIGKTVHDIYDPAQAARFEALDREAIAQGKISSREVDLSYPDGQTRHVISTRYPVFSDCGDIIGLGTINYDLSERRRMEQAVEQSEAELRALVDGSIMGVVIDRAGKPLFANQAYATIFGYDSPDEITSLPSLDSLYRPEDLARIKRYRMSRLNEKPAPVTYEFGGTRKDGTWIDLETRSRRIVWEGEPAVQSTVIDRTKRKQAERKVTEQARILESTLENLEQGVAMYDQDMKLMAWNTRYQDLRGIPEGLLRPGLSLGEVMRTLLQNNAYAEHQNLDPAACDRLVEQWLEENLALTDSRTEEQTRPDGTIQYVRDYPIPDGGGLVRTVTDITERRKLEDETARNEARFRDLAEASSHFMVELDADANLAFFHGNLRDVPEVEPGKSIGQIMLERGYDPAGMQRLFEKIQRRETFMDMPISRDHPSLGKAHLMLSGKPSFGEDGTYQGFRGTIRDVTEQVEAKAEIAAAQHELDLIKAANEAKSQFLANMSHELRTPLNAIIGFSELIKTEIFGPIGAPAYTEYAQNIFGSATHLQEIINELFDISRIEDGEYVLTPEDVPLHEVIDEVVSVMTHDATNAGLHIDTSQVKHGIRATVDRAAIRRILLNLLSNSIRFTSEGGSVSIDTVLSMDGAVSIRVTDTGKGIPPTRMGRLFEALRRDDAYIAREGGRMGMGLRIGRLLARMHGGDLTLESEVGQGTSVTILLPLDGPKADAPTADREPRAAHG